ncbi:class I SAM-dependent methyltransferase [Stenotrophomonas pavanii]|uniref:class I SAM-dependent methyltransferase n=2 Tax=Stenotrophomonas TaxID=40323 RepID=UPI0021566909|nr:methyltransferase domain-containing protein [Stenotrophomonas pavanii]
MTPTLLEIPFDHYQRYGAATHLLQALDLPAPRVLEVGANRQRLLGQFLPQATFLYTDLHAEGDEKDFVVADATALPFPEQGFDAVVSLDVLEHIPAPLRAKAAAEMARVASRAVIVGFPPDQPWVRDAEVDANGRWHELFGEDYVWLQEHKEFGLVDTAEIVAAFERAGMTVLRFGQGNATLWSSLMGAHFIKVKFPELEPLVSAADRLYNSRVFAGDHSDQPYREYCVAVRLPSDAARLQANPPFRADLDAEATALLSGLAGGLRELATRTANSEKEWESTARLLDAYIADLAVAKREWGATAAYAQRLQQGKDEADADWLQQRDQWQQAQLDWQQAERDWQQRQAVWQAQEQALEASVADAQQSLQKAQERIDGLIDASEAARAQALDVERQLEQRLQQRAADYMRSRQKWKIAMIGLGVGGFVAGVLLGWGVL